MSSGRTEKQFDLNCLDGPSELRENYGLLRRELAINQHLGELCRRREEIHG
jgi:hypothetical protein